jgi:signal transduction histidine kinase
VDLSDVALEAVERLAPLAQQRGVRLVVDTLPEINLLADRAALAQAVMNLVENGIRYTAGVGSHVTVTTRHDCTEGQAWAVARVADDGPGVAPEHLPHLFDRFYRVDAARTSGALPASERQLADGAGAAMVEETMAGREGSGLGLAIAQWAAQAHGVEVRVQSDVGVGSIFEVWLPTAVGATDNALARLP